MPEPHLNPLQRRGLYFHSPSPLERAGVRQTKTLFLQLQIDQFFQLVKTLVNVADIP
jgi:hypothetical protein